MLIDTHAHLWFPDYKDDLEQVIGRANIAGVEKMIVPGTDLESSRQAVELAKKYPGVLYAAVGVHPEETLNREYGISNIEKSPLELRDLLSRRDLVKAIGEIGTDASTDELKNCMGEQKILFKKQCEMALEYGLPVIIHTRDSLSEALEILDKLPSMPLGQFHCFSHNEDGLKEVLARGFYVSFCGNITWSKRVAKLVNLVPDNRLLLETDSPLMMPRDKSGEPINIGYMGGRTPPLQYRNEPANVRVLAEIIAELRGQNMETIERITTENAIRLFRL